MTTATKDKKRTSTEKDTASAEETAPKKNVKAAKATAKDKAAATDAKKAPAKKAAKASPAKAKGKGKAKASDDVDEDVEDDLEPVDLEVDDDAEEPEGKSARSAKKTDDDEDDDEDAKPAVSEPLPTGAIVLTSKDEDDVPVYSTQITGATADPVKDYLKQIGKVPLLNAAEEVELAMRIEAGLFAEEKLSHMSAAEKTSQLGLDLQWVARDGQRAKSHLLGANLRLVVSLAKRYTGRGM